MSFFSKSIIEAEKGDIEKLDAFLNSQESSNDSDTSLDDEEDVDLDAPVNDPVSITPNSNINVEFNDVTPYNQQVQTILSNVSNYNLDTVLMLNTAQQNLLMEAITKYQKLLQNCDEQLNRIKIMKNELTTKARENKFSSWFRCGVPYFKDKSLRHNCPANKDVYNKITSGEIALIDLPPCRFWLAHEKEALKKAVCGQSKQIRLRMIRDKSNNIQNIEQWKNKPAEECVFPVYDKNVLIDWLKISIHDLKYRHTDEDCKAMWYQSLHPHLNNKPYGPREAQKLKEIAAKHNYQNWDLIAEELGTNRSGYSVCLFNRLNQDKCNKRTLKWTPDEDNRLMSLIEKYKMGNFIPWGRIAHAFPNRDKTQIYCRYNTSLRSEFKKGKFSKQEDLMLVTLAKKFGNNIKKISSYFKERTATQIRIRYTSLILNENKIRPWTEEEDKKIIEFVKESHKESKPISWSQLEKILDNPFRNRTNIRHRWNTIKNYLNSSFEGDVSIIPRPSKKRAGSTEINQTHLDKVMKVLNNEKTKICDLRDITEEVLSTEIKREFIDQFQNFFIQKFFKIKFKRPIDDLLEIDVVNILFLINILNGCICLESLYHKRYKKCYTEHNELKIVEFLRDIVERMNENCNETLSNYLTKTYYLAQSTGHKTIDLIIPKCFLSLDQIDHLIAVTKPFLKHVIWKDSELDDFYHKPAGRFERNLKSQFFKDENLLLNLESTVVSSATSITCGDFLDNSTAKNYKTSLVTEIFKKRFLAIFNFKSMESIVKEIVDLSAHMKTEIPTDTETKQSKGLKKGRPRKRLPGGKFKYEREEDDDEEDLYNNQIKTEQNKLLTKNIKEELMSETSQNGMENDEIESVSKKIKLN